MRLARDQPFALERLEVAHDAIGRTDAEVGADLADGRPVPAISDLVLEEIVNLSLTTGQGRFRFHRRHQTFSWLFGPGLSGRGLVRLLLNGPIISIHPNI